MIRKCAAPVVGAALLALVAGGCGGSSSPPSGASCSAGLSPCASGCAELRFDPGNCGACGVVCSGESLCNEGRCFLVGGAGAMTTGTGDAGSGRVADAGVLDDGSAVDAGGDVCSFPRKFCGSQCVDTTSDSHHCGVCGSVCTNGQICRQSQCVAGCAATAVLCSGKCADTGSDPLNCGGCGHLCGAGQACHDGVCAAPCADGSGFCAGACIPLGSDAVNCGGCGIVCPTGQQCSTGVCRGVVSDWPTLGGDVHHSGFNPNESGKLPVTMAWSAPVATTPLWPAVSDGSTIYVSAYGSFADAGNVLAALSPADGHALWTHNFGAVFSIGQATVADGHVFIAQCNSYPSTYMYSFLAASGGVTWSQPFGAQWEHYWAPLVLGNRVYFDGGGYGGLYSLDETSGAQAFFANEEQWDHWSPTYLDDRVYSFTDGQLRMFAPLSGTLVNSATVPWIQTSYTMNTSPVSDGTALYVIATPNLLAFGPNLGAPLWTTNGAYSGQPSVAGGVVYSISGRQLRANDAKTGATLWTFVGDSALAYPPALAGGLVYVASDANVYAVDMATKMQAWAGTPGGWLSIAGGQLLVASKNGTLTAWSLGH